MKFKAHAYQRHALAWLFLRRSIVDRQEGSGLFLDPGLGKTAITLAWFSYLQQTQAARRALVVAPLRVIYSVWPQEIAKWDQFNHLTFSRVHGTPTQRQRALQQPADLYLINPEGLKWLYDSGMPLDFDTLIIDESSKFKNWGAQRTRVLRKHIQDFKHRVILTGTPSPNNLQDLFSQVFIVDAGASLGTGITKFRNRYFYRGGYQGYEWKAFQGAQEAIEKLIHPLVIRLSAEDHLDLPDLLIHDVPVYLPPDIQDLYDKLERGLFLELDNARSIAPSNAGSAYMTCRQVAQGGVYSGEEPRVSEHLHTAKIDAAADLVDELQGKPVLISFPFRHDLERLQERWPKIAAIDGRTTGREADRLIDQWNAGELPLLAVQPQTMSHGVNLQSGPGRDVIWLGLTDSLETYLQMNARIYRQGVTGHVRIHRILATDTVDAAIRTRLENKDRDQKALLSALASYKKEKENAQTS